jgi:hypothetical protein
VHVELCLIHSLKAPGFKPLFLNINPGFKTCRFKFIPVPLRGGEEAAAQVHGQVVHGERGGGGGGDGEGHAVHVPLPCARGGGGCTSCESSCDP